MRVVASLGFHIFECLSGSVLKEKVELEFLVKTTIQKENVVHVRAVRSGVAQGHVHPQYFEVSVAVPPILSIFMQK